MKNLGVNELRDLFRDFFVSKDLKSDRVSVMEHRKGEIRGQLDFSDVGIVRESDEDTEESTTETTIMDFRKKKA